MTTLANVSIKDNSSWTTLLNMIYPVGSYYISNSSTSPANRFGGSWSAITGRFLYANAANGTNGNNTHTHTLGAGYAYIESNHGRMEYRYKSVSNWTATWYSGEYNDSYGSMSGSHPAAVTLGGSSDSSSNMPAYKEIYCWYRTA